MTVKDYMEGFVEEYEHPFEAKVILKWINLVEANLYTNIIKEYGVEHYQGILDEYQFDLPNGVELSDVKKVLVNGVKYKKKDVRAYREKHSFWYESGKLCIYPACTQTDLPDDPKIRVVYQVRPTPKLYENIDTDTLLLPDMFMDIYDYFLMSKVSYMLKEYAESQNHTVMFNNRVNEFEEWYEENRPQKPVDEIVSGDNRYSDRVGFDYE